MAHEETLQQETRRSRDAWDRIAAGYDEHVTPSHLRLARESLRIVGLEPGDRFLDVAAGSGALSLPAARAGARVTAVDLAPTMIDRLQRRAAQEGIDLEARVMDGHALELEDAGFDLAGSQFGVMLFPDLPRALSEMVRVTRPGGRVFLNVYGPPDRVEFLAFFIRAVRSAVPDFRPPSLEGPGSPFQAADPDVLRTRLAEAGLADVRVDAIEEELTFSTGEALWDWLLSSNPVAGMLIADTTDGERAAIRAALDRMVEERGDGGKAVLTNPVHVGWGRRPA